VAFSYSLSKRRNINANLIQTTSGDLDNRLVCDTSPCRLENLPIEYTVYKKTRIIISTTLRTSSLAAYRSASLLISLVKQGRLFYLRTRILSSIRRSIVMADGAELCVITFYPKSVSTRFCSTYSVKILVSLAVLKKKMLEIPSFSCQALRHMERTLELLR
jgi:hypothetical protein